MSNNRLPAHHPRMPYVSKYQPYPQAFRAPLADRTWPDNELKAAPIWCSVDLRDGNQALVKPMDLPKKLRMFSLLLQLGFKEIEIGFPSASEVEFQFARTLIEQGLVPEDVTPQVLVQARDHLIAKTFESLAGYRRAIVHLYNSTSELQRRVVFGMQPKQVRELAIQGVRLVQDRAARGDTEIVLEYSPESFTGTEPHVALEVCSAVIEEWRPTPQRKMIINLPATVEMATPNVYADQIEWFCRNLPRRDSVVVSLHTHNDRGTGVAATELGLLAGGERVEGTLFGNGERTGNVDLVTVALNLYTHGIDPGLDLRNLPRVAEVFEQCTEMGLYPRHPYVGDLVFTAFSGSHQDAIRKGMHAMTAQRGGLWAVPYVPIEPSDIGREFDGIVRINSQSGKGGIAFLMEQEFGCHLPKEMHPEFSAIVQKVSDATGNEIEPTSLWEIFERTYLDLSVPYEFVSFSTVEQFEVPDSVRCLLRVRSAGSVVDFEGSGNGPIDACRAALLSGGSGDFRIANYVEHARTAGSDAEAVAYIQIETSRGHLLWGVGIHSSIEKATVKAVLSAVNRMGGES
jgi:2-isopropylmalate synthase